MSSWIPYSDACDLIMAANLLPTDCVHLANEPYQEPSPPDLFITIDAYSPHINMLDIGAEVYQEQGVIRVLCVAPAGTGTEAVRTLAKDVANVFRDLPPRNPYYLACSIGEGSHAENGMWYAIPVSIDFRYGDISN